MRLFRAGEGDYRQVLRRRCRLLAGLIAVGAATAAAGFLLVFFDAPIPEMAAGFYSGIGAGVTLASIVALVGTRRVLKNEKRLRAEEIKETDERSHEVTRRAASVTALVLIVAAYAAILVAIAVNLTVFYTLMAVIVLFFVVFLSATAYYDKTL